ncbi:LytR/AlgR family response regulator transcription factor [Flavobacterium silvaticum]|uniref:Response regulator transcription factor n=1 Tax=Flavobacterium silvaticum TaxID=1852020 RepID=A0A972FP36_9FLAO|nr:LytTR family DNA-binding domain-containing protein [Flavobacterium silvaticum]NMH29237.1 response regulator transcription factor [Flavobacterium silvaticum]
MRIVIIEDELPAARALGRRLEKLGLQPETMLHSVEQSVNWFGRNPQPDLIFLDIQLSDGLSFEIFEKVDISSAVIFTTAYDEYALRAFKLNSIDYLLKPIDDDELASAVEKYQRQNKPALPSEIDFAQIRKLLSNPAEKQYRSRITVKVGTNLRVIPIAEVECFYSENKGTYLHTSDNRDYPIDLTLDALEAELDPSEFFRISRKFIVPLRSSREMSVYSNSRLKLNLPTYKAEEVVVSRERVQDFRNWLGG